MNNDVTMGILGIMVLAAPLLAAITAIVTGVLARKQIAASDGALKGKGLALTGIITGALTLLGATLITTFIVFAATRAARMQTEVEAREIQALEAATEAAAGAAEAEGAVADEEDE